MKQYFLLILFICAACNVAFAQGEGNVWVFGGRAGINFNSGVPVSIKTSINQLEGSASVCDAFGRLLFYTDGTSIWNRNGDTMPNANNINGQPPNGPYTSATASTTQAAIIIPAPDSMNKYYVFSITSSTGGASIEGELQYSVVNMNLDSGRGDVEQGKKGILLSHFIDEKMTAIAGTNCNVWLLVHGQNQFNAFEIRDTGVITTPVISAVGTFSEDAYLSGQMCLSPDGKTLAVACCGPDKGGIELYDFNNATGVIANPVVLDYAESIGFFPGPYGLAFSGNGTKLYATTIGGSPFSSLYQYDLSLSNPAAITASKTFLLETQSALERGPDGKVYYNVEDTSVMGAVQQPDLSGVACQPLSNAIKLQAGTSSGIGFPNVVAVVRAKDTITTVKNVLTCTPDVLLQAKSFLGRYNFLWDDGERTISRNVHAYGTYIVLSYGECVRYVDTFHVIPVQTPLPVLTVSNNGCSYRQTGDAWVNVQTGDTSWHSYNWLDSADSLLQAYAGYSPDTIKNLPVGAYTLRIANAYGCDTTLSFHIAPSSFGGTFQLPDTAICQGDTLQLTNSFEKNSVSYYWSSGDGSTDTNATPVHHYLQPGTYKTELIVTNSLLCHDTVRYNVVVDSLPSIRFVTGDTIICQGGAIALTVTYTLGVKSLVWKIGGTTLETAISNHVHIATDTPGTFPIMVTASYPHCPDVSFSDTVTVFPFPIVNIGPDTALCPGQAPLILKNIAANVVSDYSHLWSTGATTASIEINEPNTYWLTLRSGNNCSTTDTIVVKPYCYLDIPNAFTPNGDGVNDYFFPRAYLSSGLRTFHMQIYNRWGQLVFETNSTDGRGWDGRMNGAMQPEGVFVYLIEAGFVNGATEKRQGNVTLLL